MARSSVVPGRFTAQREGAFVVFVIGMRINKLWQVWKWLPTARAMGPMIRELLSTPGSGLQHYEMMRRGRTVVLLQYWESFEQLSAYARNPDREHLPAWRAFNQRVGTDGSVGIFHETYLVPAGGFEAIYNNMPRFGLAAAGEHVPVARRGQSAAYRAGRTDEDVPAEPVPV